VKSEQKHQQRQTRRFPLKYVFFARHDANNKSALADKTSLLSQWRILPDENGIMSQRTLQRNLNTGTAAYQSGAGGRFALSCFQQLEEGRARTSSTA